MASNFDRVRPRDARPDATGQSHDPEGKRALFSSTSPGDDRAGTGAVTVLCSGCGDRSVISMRQAVRAAFPSLLLGIHITHGDTTHGVGLAESEHQAWLRCPACRKRNWVRLTLTV